MGVNGRVDSGGCGRGLQKGAWPKGAYLESMGVCGRSFNEGVCPDWLWLLSIGAWLRGVWAGFRMGAWPNGVVLFDGGGACGERGVA